MKPRFKRLLPLAAIALGLGAAGGAQAAFTVTLDTEFSGGDEPENTYTASFTSCGMDCVRLTMSITGPSTTEFIDGSTSGQFGWGFNYDPNRASELSALQFMFVSGNDANNIAVGENAFKADGDGWFDIVFSWNPQPDSRFVAGQTSVYDITGVSGLSESFFNFQSLCEQGCGNDSWTSAAHVQGIGAGGEGSGWIGGNPDNGNGEEQVPEPGTLALLGGGLFGLWALRRREPKV